MSFTVGFIILTAGVAVIGTTLAVFMATNGHATRTAAYGHRIGSIIITLGAGWLLGAAAKTIIDAVMTGLG